MTVPRVTIGMPIYNGAKYVEEALASIAAQTYSDFELIISDNASTDATETICRNWAMKDGRIRYSRNARNLGAAANYNHVIALAQGRYFKHAAHDDILAPTNIERCVAVLDQADDVVLVYPRMIMLDASGAQTDKREHSLELGASRPSERLARYIQLCDENSMCDPVFGLFRIDALRKTNMIGRYIASDMILLGEIALWGRVVEVPEYLFYERYHAEGSVLSNPTLDDRAAWFDPSVRGSLVNQMPNFRWFWELCAAVGRASLDPRERLACYAVLRHWLWRHKRGIYRDAKRVFKRAGRPVFERLRPQTDFDY